jgi:hypothetical protein
MCRSNEDAIAGTPRFDGLNHEIQAVLKAPNPGKASSRGDRAMDTIEASGSDEHDPRLRSFGAVATSVAAAGVFGDLRVSREIRQRECLASDRHAWLASPSAHAV